MRSSRNACATGSLRRTLAEGMGAGRNAPAMALVMGSSSSWVVVDQISQAVVLLATGRAPVEMGTHAGERLVDVGAGELELDVGVEPVEALLAADLGPGRAQQGVDRRELGCGRHRERWRRGARGSYSATATRRVVVDPQVGMHLGGQVLIRGQTLQHEDQLAVLGRREARTNLRVVPGCDLHGLPEALRALLGHVQGARSAVVGTQPSLAQAASLEVVDQR